MEILQSKALHMQKSFNDRNMYLEQDRSQLLGASGISSWDNGDDELVGRDLSKTNVDQLRNEQKRMLAGNLYYKYSSIRVLILLLF